MRAPLRRKATAHRRLWSGDFLSAQPLVADFAALSTFARGRLLDVGCGDRPYEALFSGVTRYVGCDVDRASSRPDVAGVGGALPFRSASFDVVLSAQVLEHVTDPLAVLGEMRRVLRPGGSLLVSAPQYWRLHEAPHDYYRFTRYGLEHLLRRAGLEIQMIRPQGGVWRLVGQAVNGAVYRRLGASIVAHLAFVIVNVSALAMEWLWRDEEDTLNYVVHATREPSSGE